MRRFSLIGGSALFAAVMALLLPSTTLSAGPPGGIPPGKASPSRFLVAREGVELGLFTSCTMMGSRSEIVKMSTTDPSPIKIPGVNEYFDVECSRPVGQSLALWNWREDVIAGAGSAFKSPVSLLLLDYAAAVVAAWELDGTWPSAIATTVGPDGATLTETVVLTCDSISRVK